MRDGKYSTGCLANIHDAACSSVQIQNMKKQYGYFTKAFFALFALVGLMFAGFATTNAVPVSSSPYRANEFSIATFGTYQATGQKTGDSTYGAGFEADYFLTRHLGVALATSKDTFHSGAFFQNITAAPILRLPIGNSGFAPYVTGGIGVEFNKGNDRYYFAGGGVEYRFTQHVSAFADGQYVFRGDVRDTANGKALVRTGLRWAF